MTMQMESLVQIKLFLYDLKILEVKISKVGSYCSFEDLNFKLWPKKKKVEYKTSGVIFNN